MDKIASALVKAQRAFGPALKTSTNPQFKSRYADLAACVEAVIEGLNGNGIALVQKMHHHDGGVAVETVFVHESGETMSAGILTVPAAKQDPQGYGSALTYARRYSLMAACGIAPEDDDGNAASKHKSGAKLGPGVIKATDGAEDAVSAERRAELDEVASYMVDCHNAGTDMDAIKMYYELPNNEDKLYVWQQLGPYSKLRATIKANKT